MGLNETERALIEAWFAVPAGEAKIEKRRQIREQFDLTPSTRQNLQGDQQAARMLPELRAM